MRHGEVLVHHVVHEAPGLAPDAPTVVLSNSLGSTMSMWDRQIAALAGEFRVVRYDSRGHGESPVPPGPYTIDELADDAVGLLDRLGLDRVHFVGLSLGGMTGLRLATRNPDRIDRLVVLCTSACLAPRHAWHDRAATVRARGTANVAQAVVDRWYTEGYHMRRPDLIEAAVATVAATPAEGYASCCEAIGEMDQTDDLPSVVAPTLAIAGADDPATPPPHLQRIADGVRDGRLLVVPEAGHLANDEQPEIINPAILEHLSAASAAGR